MEQAVEEGYPKTDGQALTMTYPDGLTCLSPESFQRAVARAGASMEETLIRACDALTVSAAGYKVQLNARYWREPGTALILKTYAAAPLIEMARDATQWSFPPESSAEAVQTAVNAVYRDVPGSPVEAAFTDPSWRGCIAVKCPTQESIMARCVTFPLGARTLEALI